MIPCKLCSAKNEAGVSMPFDANGKPLRGLKQTGKTKMLGTCGERFYTCQDCGAKWRMVFDSATKQSKDIPVFQVH